MSPIEARHAPPATHVVQFYTHEHELIESVGIFLAAGLKSGATCVVVATPEHRKRFEAALDSRVGDVAQGATPRYIQLDALETQSTFFVDGRLDEGRFRESMGRVLAEARSRSLTGNIRIFGEMVALLWAEGKEDVAIELEEVWERYLRDDPSTLLCAYPVSAVAGMTDRIDAAHTHSFRTGA